MVTRKAHGNSIAHQAASRVRRALMAALLPGLAWCSIDAALGEDGKAPFDPGQDVFSLDSAHRQPLDLVRLDDIRGRNVPASKLELDEPLSVILWDEGRGSHSGSNSGTSQPTQQGSNQQHQSLRTTSVR